jgi:hypothetical protein
LHTPYDISKVILCSSLVIIVYIVSIPCTNHVHVVNLLHNLTCKTNLPMVTNFYKYRYPIIK